MRKIVFFATVCLSFGAFSGEMDSRIRKLELKVERLENRLKNRVEVHDMKNQKVKGTATHRSLSSQNMLSKAKQKEIQQALTEYKKRQKESQKLLDDLMQEP
jgi:hypothetical protein